MSDNRLYEASMILNIQERYNDFGKFYYCQKGVIYEAIVKAFCKLAETDAAQVSLVVNATVENINWDTHFKINIKRLDLLTEYILPYYTQNESFEKCAEIKSILQKLIKSNHE